MTASYADTRVQRGLRGALLRHALLRGWIGPLLVLWAVGLALFLAYWDIPILAGLWNGAAIAIGALMVANELRSQDVARGSLAVGMARTLKIDELSSVQDAEQLTRNVATFVEIAVRMHAAGPGPIKDPNLVRCMNNLYQLLSMQSEAAHKAELTWELELSPEVYSAFASTWDQLSNVAVAGSSSGPRFATEFARATQEALTKVRGELSSRRPEPDAGAPPEKERNELVRITHVALRNLGNPAVLARCGLVAHLPHTLESASSAVGVKAQEGRMTPLEQARLLRTVIVSAIERFSSAGGSAAGGPEALQYVILNERYVLKRPISATITRHSIGESTFHRSRREGINALAAELAAQEENLARGKSATTQS